VLRQIHQFTQDLAPVRMDRPCTISDGIVVFSPSDCHRLQQVYKTIGSRYTRLKFVPSSGAASRMFKHLYNYTPDSVSDLTEQFILQFQRFPFIEPLRALMLERKLDLDAWIAEDRWSEIFELILSPEGLNYDSQLKGLVVFHQYDDGPRTAFEEHLAEATRFARNLDGSVRVHFTLAEQHVEWVKGFLSSKIQAMPFDQIEASVSIQLPSTDTIALNRDNLPFRDAQGQMVFRPSGHGALIHNLQNIDADIIFIKNIDNITTENQLEEIVYFKQVLAGHLVELKNETNRLLDLLEQNDDALEDALEFIQAHFQPGLPLGMNRDELRRYAMLRLDRPMRVCGMVRNEGEPGGGPFWVRSKGGYLSKQIVEKSQMNQEDAQQMKLLSSSTHFNPVDIVCSIKNRRGENYDLNDFIDHSMGFISEKFHQGHVMKALELPGLWNGAMALWNTVFVEVPLSTFHPVKTVNDLLRPGHQTM
ncbi:MAG: DUF4301 family protein, partial [Flavobacteriales bacterium]